MSELVAALPMYDWPEVRDEVDAQWVLLRDAFRQKGIDAPEAIVRRNGDLPPVPGGIRDAAGALIAPDPATLPPDELDFHRLWLHPLLLFAQTCWGPMELGLSRHVQVVG
ncbi:phosphate ABC transporter substrate-binding protein, partial [Mesorhizobium sp. M7A.F.Ca.CA.001.08.1.1]